MPVSGYASATSVKAGETLTFYFGLVDSRRTTRLTTFIIENVADATVTGRFNATVRVQATPAQDAWKGFGWTPTLAFQVPANWPSGLYRLIYINDGVTQNVLSFVVAPDAAQSSARTLLHVSYLTPAAYNNSGGRGFYSPRDENDAVDRARKVSFDRPSLYPRLAEDESPDIYINEAKLLNWLHDADQPIDCCSSIDLHSDPALLCHYDCLVLAFHDEYWTKAMRDHCEAFVRNGGNIICLSGNTCYRQVRLENNNRTVVFYKYAQLDPMRHENLDEVTVAWTEPPVNRPQNHLLGVGFTQGAFSLAGRDRRPYDICFPDHWVFQGIDAQQTSPFLFYETDAAAYVDEDDGYPRVTGEEGTPLNTTILAKADLRHWFSKPGRATMTIFSRNGTVFNAANTHWIAALGSDPVVDQITRNVFARLARPVPWNWEHVGEARNATAMAATDGKLFLCTSENDLWRRYPVGAHVPWTKIGHANHVTTMASADGYLYCVTSDNLLWARPLLQADAGWQRLGQGPAAGTKAIAGASGMIYAIDSNGALHRRTAQRQAGPTFTQMPWIAPNRDIVALTTYSDILFAATSTNRLLRTNRDFISESDDWHDLHHCNFAIGLAVVEWMLYVVTSENALWRIDLSGVQHP
ncbi:N,N-dimethylformamidase beta subunit family domain-containing protein [Loktanella sp. Alg231-35]|uniref:N,N-dimethylformamidase beta subunit family domain-containing protein n=1 Tax=Loktanella sp. Alg231-35 TaxID=1922220 RepID=UPI000D561D4D|nr:N,N-dimethylformamidase beta subunit family domain-containing protein [Loktanella sp. Alg231-35]